MGTEYYLIDHARRIAFDCHKWRALAITVGARTHPAVTVADIRATAPGPGRCNQPWLRLAAERWMLWHGLESAELVNDEDDNGRYPPDAWLDDDPHFDVENPAAWACYGWRLCSLWGDVAAEMAERMDREP